MKRIGSRVNCVSSKFNQIISLWVTGKNEVHGVKNCDENLGHEEWKTWKKVSNNWSIPRLPLRAATLAVKASVQLRKHPNAEIHEEVFWIDNIVWLGYIQNTTKWFKIITTNFMLRTKGNPDLLQWQ